MNIEICKKCFVNSFKDFLEKVYFVRSAESYIEIKIRRTKFIDASNPKKEICQILFDLGEHNKYCVCEVDENKKEEWQNLQPFQNCKFYVEHLVYNLKKKEKMK